MIIRLLFYPPNLGLANITLPGNAFQQATDRVGLVRLLHLRLQLRDPCVEIFDLFALHGDDLTHLDGDGVVARHPFQQCRDETRALGHDHAELAGMAAHRVD